MENDRKTKEWMRVSDGMLISQSSEFGDTRQVGTIVQNQVNNVWVASATCGHRFEAILCVQKLSGTNGKLYGGLFQCQINSRVDR